MRNKYTIIYLAQYPYTWYSFQTVYEALQVANRFDCKIVAIKSLYPPSGVMEPYDKITSFLQTRGIPYIDGANVNLRDLSPDLIFVPGPFDHSKEEPYFIRNLLKIAPLAYIPYGFEIGGGFYIQQQFNYKLHNCASIIFSRSHRHKGMYKKYCEKGDNHVYVTGHPKSDLYFKPIDKNKVFRSYNITKDEFEKIFIWNPHFQVELNNKSISTFLNYFEFMLKLAAKYRQHLFIFRPHPALGQRLKHLDIMSESQWDILKEELNATHNIRFSEEYDYFGLFHISDALISDISSFLFEYIPTEKPILYTPNILGPSTNDDGSIVDYYYKAYNESNIEHFVDMIEHGFDPMKEVRIDNTDRYLYKPDGHAGDRIANYLQQNMEKLTDQYSYKEYHYV